MTSAAAGGRADGIPRDGRTQIALAGRSNVGKSTLINALCRRKIARTSAAPGKTRLANVYRVTFDGGAAGRWEVYLVDLPGYGYARGGAASAEELAEVAEAYFSAVAPEVARDFSPATRASAAEPRFRPTTVTTLLLVDSRHPGLDADRHAYEWLIRKGTTPHIVGMKVDKLSRSERARNFTRLKEIFGTAALPVSAATGEGLDDLWKLIAGHRRTQKTTDPGHTDPAETNPAQTDPGDGDPRRSGRGHRAPGDRDPRHTNRTKEKR